MKRIDVFVDSVYQNVGGNRKEIQELKAEMKSHLLEAVHELIKEGKSEQEAIDIAIDRFGGENEIRSMIGQWFKAQKIFAKSVLYVAVTVLVLTSMACAVIWAADEENRKENSIVSQKIFGILENKETISGEMKKEIDALAQGADHILKVHVYKMSDVKRETANSTSYSIKEANPAYQNEKNAWAPEWMLQDLFYANGGDEWFVYMETRRIFALMSLVSSVGVAVYATLFTIWAIVNAYHHQRLNLGWILVFALFNVFGYGVYRLLERKVHSNTVS